MVRRLVAAGLPRPTAGADLRGKHGPAVARPAVGPEPAAVLQPGHSRPASGSAGGPGKSRVRKDVTVKLSYDEGQTWPVTKRLENGLSGYSDLAVGPDGTIYCFYECASTDGNVYRSGNLTLARFNLPWLTDGHDALPETTE